jgi:hypothetical protein
MPQSSVEAGERIKREGMLDSALESKKLGSLRSNDTRQRILCAMKLYRYCSQPTHHSADEVGSQYVKQAKARTSRQRRLQLCARSLLFAAQNAAKFVKCKSAVNCNLLLGNRGEAPLNCPSDCICHGADKCGYSHIHRSCNVTVLVLNSYDVTLHVWKDCSTFWMVWQQKNNRGGKPV